MREADRHERAQTIEEKVLACRTIKMFVAVLLSCSEKGSAKKKSQKHKGKLLDLVAVLSYSKDHSCVLKDEKTSGRPEERSKTMKQQTQDPDPANLLSSWPKRIRMRD